MIRVVIADDHPVVLEGLGRLLARCDDVILAGSASSADEATAALERFEPDVLVLDMGMPGMHGSESVQQICEARPDVRVVVFTMHGDERAAVNALMAGATGYVNKADPPTELVDAIRAAAAGRRYVPARLRAALSGSRGADAGTSAAAPHERLSDRERQVFDGIVAGRAAKQIADDLQISQSSVHTYTDRIKGKLEVSSIRQIFAYAFRLGLVSEIRER